MSLRRPPISQAMLRTVNLRCPACGKSSIIARPFRIAESCKTCGVHFKREQGFFVGAILINVVTTEVLILFVYLVLIGLFNFDSQYALPALFFIAVGFPILFYHHSWSLWLSFDHFIEGLPGAWD